MCIFAVINLMYMYMLMACCLLAKVHLYLCVYTIFALYLQMHLFRRTGISWTFRTEPRGCGRHCVLCAVSGCAWPIYRWVRAVIHVWRSYYVLTNVTATMQCQQWASLGAVLMYGENALRMSEGSMFVIFCTCPAGLCVATSFRVYYQRQAGQWLDDNDHMGIVKEEEHGLDERNPDALIP